MVFDFLAAMLKFGGFLLGLLGLLGPAEIKDDVLAFATTNYTGSYSFAGLYDNYAMTNHDFLVPSYTLMLNLSPDDKPNDKEDLYDMLLSNGMEDVILAQMGVTIDIVGDYGARNTDAIAVTIVYSTIPETASDVSWSVEEAIFNVLPFLSQIRFYDVNETELVLGGPSGSLEFHRVLA